MSKTILVFSNSISGLYTFRKEVMTAIAQAGYSVYLVGPEDDNKIKHYDDLGCTIVPMQFSARGMNPFSDLNLLRSYHKLIKQYEPQAVLTYTIKPNIYGGMACRLNGVPQLANITGLGDALENKGWLRTLTILLYRLGLSKARKVFFQNQYNREFCRSNGIVSNNTGLLPGSGVNLNYHQFQPYPQDDVLIFVFMGRLIHDKGAVEYLDAVEVIGRKYPKVQFWILGMYNDEFKERIERLIKIGYLKFIPSKQDIRPVLSDVHCSIMPSYHEGMSNVNLESAANGRPVITTNVPGCKETVDDGITGYLVESRNSNSLISAIEKFINKPYEEKKLMGQAARKKVEREFDRQIVVDAYLKEIQLIANV